MSENSLFNIYKEQFDILYNKLKKIIESLRSARKDFLFLDYEKYKKEAERLMKQMELDINLDGVYIRKNVFTGKWKILNDLKRQMENINKELNKLKNSDEFILTLNNTQINNSSPNNLSSNEPLIETQVELKISESHKTNNKTNFQSLKIEKSSNQKNDFSLQASEIISYHRLSNSNAIIRFLTVNGQRSKIFLLIFCITLISMSVLILYTKL